jgi:type II secretion system protein G
MFTSITNRNKGFTLIELLVVIAIIGILSSVVLASLGTARQKARDATRVSDIKNIQLALELFFDGSQGYPANTDGANAHLFPAAAATNVTGKLVPTYLPQLPANPTGTTVGYVYKCTANSGTTAEVTTAGNLCGSFILGASLERTDNISLNNDNDATITGGTSITGAGTTCIAAGTEQCYSIRP